MGNAPRPGVFALERSTDYGQTWKPWQYFADTPSDCHQFFAEEHPYTDRIEADDSVICTTDYSKVVPFEGGEVCFFYHTKKSPVLTLGIKSTEPRMIGRPSLTDNSCNF